MSCQFSSFCCTTVGSYPTNKKNGKKATHKDVQYEALKNLLAVTDKEVDWVNEVWDILLEWLTDRDKHRRSRSAQFLSNLALSDPEKRFSMIFLSYGR
jgi:hypothetical protein